MVHIKRKKKIQRDRQKYELTHVHNKNKTCSNLKDADEDAIDDFHNNKFWCDTQSDVRIPVHCQ